VVQYKNLPELATLLMNLYNVFLLKYYSYFGREDQPRVCVGWENEVLVDCEGRAQISSKKDFQDSVSHQTWQATMKYVESLKHNDIKIAFFNSTPQGGGVALMRHALIRFLRTVDVKAGW
jgi:hypothetical protein